MTEQTDYTRNIRDLLLLTSGPAFGSIGGVLKLRTIREKNHPKERIKEYLNECLDKYTDRYERKDRLINMIKE